MYRLRSQCANCALRQLQMCGVAVCSTTRLLSSTSSSTTSDNNKSNANINENDMGSQTAKLQNMKNEGNEQQELHNATSSSSFTKEQTTNTNDTNNSNTTNNYNSKHNSSSDKNDLWSLERDSTGESSSTNKTSHYRFPTQDVLNAVKKGDFDKIQAHATELVKHNWRDEYVIPTYCVSAFLLCWWFAAWRSRALRRRCNKLITSIEQEASQMVERVRALTEKYSKDMTQAQQRMEGIIDKNSALTADIDRMTTILRSCSIKPTP